MVASWRLPICEASSTRRLWVDFVAPSTQGNLRRGFPHKPRRRRQRSLAAGSKWSPGPVLVPFERFTLLFTAREPHRSPERLSHMWQREPGAAVMSDRLLYSTVGGISVFALAAVAAIVLAGM